MKTTALSHTHFHVVLVALRRVAGGARAPVLCLLVMALTILLMAWTSRGQTVVFSDCFTNGSTLNSLTPAAPAATMSAYADTNSLDGTNYSTSCSTSYEIINTGTRSPAPSITKSNLDFGLAASSYAQNIQVQALFNTVAVNLELTNDYIQLAVTFTDKKGILTNSVVGSSYFFLGLFNSGSDFSGDTNFSGVTNFPVAGGLTNAVNTSSSAAVGWAQDWVGYSDHTANSQVNSSIDTRVQQTGTGNNNQDVLCGSALNSTDGYANPGPNITFFGSGWTMALTNGRQYTEVMTLMLMADTTISNSISLYAGADTNGTLLAQYGANQTGVNFATNSFDAFAIGWLQNDHNVASEIAINQITVTAYQQSDISSLYVGDVAPDESNIVYIADADDNVVLAYVDDGTGTNAIEITVAGNGTAGYSGDGGSATNASLNYPCAVVVDASGNFYIADASNNVVRMVTTNGIISTVAGNGTAGYSGDGGVATNASLDYPDGVAADASGNLYIAEAGNNVIRVVTPAGYIGTAVGNGSAGYSGDGGSSDLASLNSPVGVSVNDSGGIVICDSVDNVFREAASDGTISTTTPWPDSPAPVTNSVWNLHTMVATATNSDGRLDIFAVAGDGYLYHKYQTNANVGPWSPWISLDTSKTFNIYASPAVRCDAVGCLMLFIVGTNGQMYRYKENTAANDTTWSSSFSLGGNFLPFARVGTAMSANGTLWGFAVSQTNDQLQAISQATPGGSWSSWANLGGTWDSQSDVAVGQNPDGSLSLFMIGVLDTNNANALFEKQQNGANGSWLSWTNRGGLFSYKSYIGLANNANGNLEFFIVNNDPNGTQEVMNCWKTNSTDWRTNWVSLGTNTWRTTYQVPFAIQNQNGELGVFMVGWDGDMHYNYRDPVNGWTGWDGTNGLGNIGNSGVTFRQGIGISAVMNLNGNLDIFGVNKNGSLYRAVQDNPNGGFSTGWVSFAGIPLQ